MKSDLAKLFVDVTLIEDGKRWTVSSGDKRAGQSGKAIAVIALRHSPGYEVVLQLDSGKLESFAPMALHPEAIQS